MIAWFAALIVVAQPGGTGGPDTPVPPIPRHFGHIRIAQLAYDGNPMGPFEDRLLARGVDLVVPNAKFLDHIGRVAPRTPKLIYSNVSNLYEDLLVDWLRYADLHGVSREGAFFHAARPIPFSGDSPSSRPVAWFWGVYRTGRDGALTDLSREARGTGSRAWALGGPGDLVYVGYPEKFREIRVELASGGRGCAYELEYAQDDRAHGRPPRIAGLKVAEDTTQRLSRSGRIAFDPPRDWSAAALRGSPWLYFVRIRITEAAVPPMVRSLLGRDYVGAGGKTRGTIPAFDADADGDRDGYLNDAEYARRDTAKEARFRYEGRMFVDGYGQMRFVTNPADPDFRRWAADNHRRLLARHPRADGVFMDNSSGKPLVRPDAVLEPAASYTEDYGAMIGTIHEAIRPRWILLNVVGGREKSEAAIRRNPAYLEEFLIRPLVHHYKSFEDVAALVERRSSLTSPPPLAILDSRPDGGSPTDPRTQISTLAYYYLLADPDRTFLMLYGGYEPASPWAKHWTEAIAYDIGRPTARWSLFATGADPANSKAQYRVYRRPYARATVYYKPLSFESWKAARPGLGEQTATVHPLDGLHRPLQADGRLGAPTLVVRLRNGEGAIMIRGGGDGG